MRSMHIFCASVLLTVLFAAGCLDQSANPSRATRRVTIDGSSTLGPLMDIARDLFQQQSGGIDVQAATSGTSNGFKRFLSDDPAQRIDICKASRPILPDEVSKAAAVGVNFIELPIAYDGIVVAVNPANDWCDHLTHDELRAIWAPESTIKNWSQVRPGFPDVPLKLFGPGRDSGTFDVFTEFVNGKARQSRNDYLPSESDNFLVVGVSGERGALGYFGFGHLEANIDKIKAVPLAWGGSPPVAPSAEAIRSGSYALARPTFLYTSLTALDKQDVTQFLTFVFTNPVAIVEHPRVRNVALSDELYAHARERLSKRVTGTVYVEGVPRTAPLTELYLKKDGK